MAGSKAWEEIGPYYQLSKDELRDRIRQSREAQNALLLAHNYQRPEIQELADILGDSLELARQAEKADCDRIVLCGVRFMAETAKILNPGKRVILPDRHAGCPMADLITAQQLREWKSEHPGAKVVCYVNSSAEVKAECDICCTSSNAVAVVQSLGDVEILFAPDKNLGTYAALQTGARILAWEGHCHVHQDFTLAQVEAARKNHPQALLVVHPECPPEVFQASDAVASTAGMIALVAESSQNEFVVGTEIGLIELLQKRHPEKHIYSLRDNAVCPNMKRIDLAKLAWAIENDKWEVTIPSDVGRKALEALKRMMAI